MTRPALPCFRWPLILAPLCLCWATVAPAQEELALDQKSAEQTALKSRPQEVLYQGIIPSKRDSMQGMAKTAGRKGRAKVTWIGFQPTDTMTRVFVQAVGGVPEHETVRSEDGRVMTVILKNVAVENSNVLRFIDTSFYKRPVTRIEAKRRGKDLHLLLNLEPGAAPSVTASEDTYLYIDLPR